jgi:hypothetical protein
VRKGIFSHHEPCPKCRERGGDTTGNNLGVYQDGHKYCFKCSYYEPSGESLNTAGLGSRITNLQGGQDALDAPRISLPSDYSPHLAVGGLRWLRQYGIKQAEIEEHKIGWSGENESLIFPVFDLNNHLLFVQERFFDNPRRKYKTHGKTEEVFHILGPKTDTVVLVEDMVSAIKIARNFEVMPLWGSSISQDRILRLSRLYDRVAIWLDNDKAHYAIRRATHMRPFFDSVTTIVTEFDPKEYDDDEISNFVLGE